MEANNRHVASRETHRYSTGLGALTGGTVSAAYLVYAISLLPDPTDIAPVFVGLLLAAVGATLVNSLFAMLFLEFRFGNTRGISEYAAGTVIGTVVVYSTIFFYLYNTM